MFNHFLRKLQITGWIARTPGLGSGSGRPRSSQTAYNTAAVTILWRAMWRIYEVIKPVSKKTVDHSFLFWQIQKACNDRSGNIRAIVENKGSVLI